MMRGINRQQIFEDRNDCEFFAETLRKIAHPENGDRCCDIYAYALMGNHFHILLGEEKASVGEAVKRMAIPYVIYFNRRHGRDGHLFKERFRSEPCDSREYFVTLLRYIHQNPLKAGMVKRIEDYEFTSWHEYITDVPPEQRICNTSFALGMIDKESLVELVNEPLSDDVRCIEYEEESRKSISDSGIADHLRQRHHLNSPLELQRLDKAQRDEILASLLALGAGVRQLQRLTGIGKNIISRQKTKII